MRGRWKKILLSVLLVGPVVALTIANFCFVGVVTHKAIDQPFPGYLTFKNGMVGGFYVPGWSGVEQGLSYHDWPPLESDAQAQHTFSEQDYWLVVLIPALAGLGFALVGALIFLVLARPAWWPCSVFIFWSATILS